MLKPIVNIYKLGRLPYLRALDIQRVLFNRLRGIIINNTTNYNINNNNHTNENEKITNSLLLVEHEPVYTIGLRTNSYDDNYVSRLKIELDKYDLKADFATTNRGGLITFHGPGQLVAYPIIYLGHFTRSLGGKKSLKAYVNKLEETVIDTLARVGIPDAHTVLEYPGVWLDEGQRKIAFIGIHCNRYVTMHGISINCDCDLTWFDHIVSCGIKDKAITSIKQELSTLSSRINESPSPDQLGIKPNNTPTNKIKSISSINITKSTNERDTDQSASEHEHRVLSCSTKAPDDIDLLDSVSEAFCTSFKDHFDCTLSLKPTKNNW